MIVSINFLIVIFINLRYSEIKFAQKERSL